MARHVFQLLFFLDEPLVGTLQIARALSHFRFQFRLVLAQRGHQCLFVGEEIGIRAFLGPAQRPYAIRQREREQPR